MVIRSMPRITREIMELVERRLRLERTHPFEREELAGIRWYHESALDQLASELTDGPTRVDPPCEECASLRATKVSGRNRAPSGACRTCADRYHEPRFRPGDQDLPPSRVTGLVEFGSSARTPSIAPGKFAK